MRFATAQGDRELRFAEFGTSAVPAPLSRIGGALGMNVTSAQAIGLPAVIACIRIVSETIAAMPLKVYSADREPAVDSTQWRLLHDAPNEDQTSFDFMADISASIEGYGNAYIHKIRSRGQVVEMRCIPAPNVRVRQDPKSQALLYDIRLPQGQLTNLTRADVLHIRGFSVNAKAVAPSPIEQHRETLGTIVALTRFQNAFFTNDARPGVVLKMPNSMTKEQARETADLWDDQHAGAGSAHRTAVLGGGADVVTLPISLVDAEFIAGQRFGMEQIARIFNVPSVLITEPHTRPQSTDDVAEHFLKFSLAPRLRRIEHAFAADKQLFGPKAGDLHPEFLADAILRPATSARYSAYVQARQAGWVTANEIRGLENLKPLDQPGANDLQATPVGGAPNPGLTPDAPPAAAIDPEL